MWTKSKDLHSLVKSTINSQQSESLEGLEKALKSFRSHLSALLKQPVAFFKNHSFYTIVNMSKSLLPRQKMLVTEIYF